MTWGADSNTGPKTIDTVTLNDPHTGDGRANLDDWNGQAPARFEGGTLVVIGGGTYDVIDNLDVFIDDDVSVSENWLSTYLAAYDDPGVSAAGGRVVPIWESPPPDWIDVVPHDYFSLLDFGIESRPLAGTESINGCNYSIRRESLFSAGGFHPDSYRDPSMIWLRGDGEAGLIRKLRSRHEQVMYLADAEVGHRIPDDRLSIASLSSRAFAHGIENGYTFARKRHCRAWSLAALYLMGIFATLKLIPMYGIGSKTMKNTVRRKLAAARYRAIRSYAMRCRCH